MTPMDEMELVPFSYFYGRCEEALEFYKAALGGAYDIGMRGSGNTISYARFTAPGIAFAASDGASARAVDPNDGNVSLSLSVGNEAKAERIFGALAGGGRVVTPFGAVPWGGQFGVLHDRFGNQWFVSSNR